MSKITVALLIILLIFVGILLFIMYGTKQNSFITSLTRPIKRATSPSNTTLSFSTAEQAIAPGQTITLAILLNNPNPPASLAQLELAYDPTMLTVDAVTPGTFFTNPTVALQKIDPLTGRISYALRCPESQATDETNNCVNTSSSTLAILTLTVNSYAIKNTTTLSFLPKTVVRTRNGQDILQSTSGIQLTISKSLYPAASSSAVGSPGANILRVTPTY